MPAPPLLWQLLPAGGGAKLEFDRGFFLGEWKRSK